MKIGILTYHRTLNYGACLQAVATRIVLEKMGHEVCYVDYWPKYHQGKYKVFSWLVFINLSWKKRANYLWEQFRNRKFIICRAKNFAQFSSQYIIPYCRPLTESYDVVIYGSDQIWRKQKETKAYNPIYFGKNRIKAKKHISYAASMGVLPNNERDKTELQELVSNLDSISVREKDLQDMLCGMGFTNVSLTIDPTLLMSCREWNETIPASEYNDTKYVLVYGIGRASFDMREVNRYAQDHNCIVKVLQSNGTAEDTDTMITTAAPNTFIHLIKNSECIFTSSFHGLAFSIIYHKEFYASFVSQKVSRAQTLLSFLGLNDRLLSPNATIPSRKNINYDIVDNNLQIFREESLRFLKNNINI